MNTFLKKQLLIVSLLFKFIIYAQTPVSINLTEKDGLPDIKFYDIIEDKQGFIWLAADKGLYRYDGVTFKHYTHLQKKGLSVFGLTLDQEGKLWCNNLSRQFFYIKNDSLQLFKTDSLYINKPNNLLPFTLYKDRLVISSNSKLSIYNTKTKDKSILVSKDGSNFDTPVVINDTLLIASKNKLQYLNDKNELISYNTVFTGSIKKKTEFRKPFLFKQKVFLERTNRLGNKSSFYIKQRNQFKKLKLPAELNTRKIITTTIIDDLLWVTTNKGVFVLNFIANELVLEKSYFASNFITKVLKDKNHNYWFTTLHNGIFIIPNIHLKEYKLPKAIENITSLTSIDSNTVVFGTANSNLVKYQFLNNTFKINKLSSELSVGALCNNIYNDYIYISTDDASFIYNKRTNHITNKGHLGIGNKFVEGFSNSKSLSLVDSIKVLQVDHGKIRLLHFHNDRVIKKKILKPNIRSYTCYYSPLTQKSYIGSLENLVCFSSNLEPKVIQYKGEPIFAIDIKGTNDGLIWVSTFSKGIFVIKNDKVIANYTTKNGLLSNQTSTIQNDENNLWITTSLGIQYLNTTTKTFKNLTKRDGIISYNVRNIEILGNQVYFATNKGLFSISKHKAFKKRNVPSPFFTSITIADKEVKLKSNYKLSHDQNKINIAFNTTGFQSIKNIKYQYRLKGYDTNWNTVKQGNNNVLFNSLQYGKYVFELRAFNEHVTSEIKQINISISQVFYKQWWFYLLITILTILFIWGYFFNKNKRLKTIQKLVLDKQTIDHENVSLKLESLRSQMNPHFIFNALNSIQDYVINNEKKLARKYLVKFSRLIRIYLEHSQKEIVDLHEEIAALKLYLDLEKDRFEDSFVYIIELSENLKKSQIKIPTFLIQPYVENAIKHGLLHKKVNRQLSVYFYLQVENNTLKCVIKDNGIGREASAKINAKHLRPKSFSSNANQKRINLLNKTREKPISLIINDMHDEYNKATGTRVVLTIPL